MNFNYYKSIMTNKIDIGKIMIELARVLKEDGVTFTYRYAHRYINKITSLKPKNQITSNVYTLIYDYITAYRIFGYQAGIKNIVWLVLNECCINYPINMRFWILNNLSKMYIRTEEDELLDTIVKMISTDKQLVSRTAQWISYFPQIITALLKSGKFTDKATKDYIYQCCFRNFSERNQYKNLSKDIANKLTSIIVNF